MPPTADQIVQPVAALRQHHDKQQLAHQQQKQELHQTVTGNNAKPSGIRFISGGTDASSSQHVFPVELKKFYRGDMGEVQRKVSQEGERSMEVSVTTTTPSSSQELRGIESRASHEFLQKEPVIYSHRIFQRAAKIFAVLRHTPKPAFYPKLHQAIPEKPPSLPDLDFQDTYEKKLTYELAFAALKYQILFEDVIDESSFFKHFPELSEDSALVIVMLWDFQSRKFQTRSPIHGEVLDEQVLQIEQAILELKTKLNAALARRRIKASAPSIEYLLSDKVRSKTSTQQAIPICTWVNQFKISPVDLLQWLHGEGFEQLPKMPSENESFDGMKFYADPHCSDVLIFSQDCAALLLEHPLVLEGLLVRQDKSSCMAMHTILPLITDDQDVLLVNPASGLAVAHLASLLREKSSQLLVIGETRPEAYAKMHQQLEFLGATINIKIIQQAFTDVEIDDYRLRNVRVAVVIADCSKSAIKNAVSFVVNEGEDAKILKELSVSEEDPSYLSRLMGKHISHLRHAIRIPRMQAVVYLTRSIHDEENEIVVQKATEQANMMLQQQHHNLHMQSSFQAWVNIPPLIPFSGEDIDSQRGIVGKYVKFSPTSRSNGYFIAVVAKEPEAPSAIIARAQTKGLLKGTKSKSRTSRNYESSHSSTEVDPEHSTSVDEPKHHRSSKKTRKGLSSSKSSIRSNAARLSSTSMVQKESKEKTPEHMKVVKHPAPFR